MYEEKTDRELLLEILTRMDRWEKAAAETLEKAQKNPMLAMVLGGK